jgi:hypothetical protein
MPEWFAPVISVVALLGVIVSPLVSGLAQWATARGERRLDWRQQRLEYLGKIMERLVELRVEAGMACRAGDFDALARYSSEGIGLMLGVGDMEVRSLVLALDEEPRFGESGEPKGDLCGDALDWFDNLILGLGQVIGEDLRKF